MTRILLIALILLAILSDIYIWRRNKSYWPLWLRRLYALATIGSGVLALSAIMAYRYFSLGLGSGGVQTVMWLTLIFFITTLPMLTYAVVSLLDYLPVWRKKGPRTRIFGWLGILLGLFVFGRMLWGATSGRTRIVVQTVEITSDSLPASFDGYTIAFFTDPHVGTLTSPRKMLRKLTDKINGLQPDLIVHGGDLVNIAHTDLGPTLMAELAKLSAPDGVLSVLGNHDLGMYIPDTARLSLGENLDSIVRKQQQMGWTVLQNQTQYIRRDSDSIAVTGVGFPLDPSLNGFDYNVPGADLEQAYGDLPEGLFNVTVSHTPDLWDDILVRGAATLTLSGHVHAMQFKLNAGKWSWSPASWKFKRWSRLYAESARHLYINDGIGCVLYPMRIGAPPEVTVIILKRKGK